MHLHPHLHQMHRVAILAVALCALAHTELAGAVLDGLADAWESARPAPPQSKPHPDELLAPPRGTRVPGTYYFWELMDARYPMGDA